MSEPQALSPDGPSEAPVARPPGPAAGTGILLFLAGAVLGLFGGFLQAVAPRIGAIPVPVGAVLVTVTLVACIRAVIHHYDARRPGVVLLLGWLLMSVLLAVPWPGGDVVIGKNPIALVYLFGGVVVASAAANLPARLRPPVPPS